MAVKERKDVVQAHKKAIQARQDTGLDTPWKSAFRYTYPLRGQRFFQNQRNGMSVQTGAHNDQASMFDTTGKDSSRLLASSCMSGLTPANSQWLGLCPPNGYDEDSDEDKAFREWLDTCAHVMHKKVHSSNYDSEGYDFFLGMVIGGMCGLYIEPRNGNYYFEYWPLETLYVADTLGNGRIDTVYRQLDMTAAQIAERFGNEALTQDMRDEIEKDPGCTKKHAVIHTIRPRIKNKKQTNGMMKKTFPFESLYVCKETGTLFKEDGYRTLPIIVPRWNRVPGTDYAVGPVDDALPDIKTANKLAELKLMNADMAASGMYVAKNDGVINPATIKIGARRIIMAGDTTHIKPIAPAGDFQVTHLEMERVAANIRRILMSDQLQPQQSGPAMTATEVYVRVNLIRQLLGPMYGRFQAEMLQPMIERLFDIAVNEGWVPPAPPEALDREWIPQYQSPLARAQKLEDVQAIQQYEQDLATTAQLNPTVLDYYDTDKAAVMKANLRGVPETLIRPFDEVKKIRKDRAEQQQAAAQAEAMTQMAQMEKAVA